MSGNYWVINKDLVKEIGLDATFMLTNLIEAETIFFKDGNVDNDGWFYQTSDTLSKVMYFSEFKQNKAIDILINKGFIEKQLRDLPRKRYFRICNEGIISWLIGLDEYRNNFGTSSQIISELTINNLGTSSQKICHNKESNNKKNNNKNIIINNNKKDKSFSFCSYTDNNDLIIALNDFLEMRKQTKSKMTDRAIKLMLNKLDELASNDNDKIKILNQSIMNGWKGLFPLNNKEAINGTGKQSNSKVDDEVKYETEFYNLTDKPIDDDMFKYKD